MVSAPRLPTRADTFRDDVIAAIRGADVVLVRGGDSLRMVRVVRVTSVPDTLRRRVFEAQSLPRKCELDTRFLKQV